MMGHSTTGLTVGAACALVVGASAFLPSVAVAQVATGFTVDFYASVEQPRRLSFDPATGDLFVGHGSNDARPISVVRGADQSVEAFGGDVADADAVLFDATGSLTGTPGGVLVGSGLGLFASTSLGSSAALVTSATGGFSNPTELIMDGTGTVYFTDYQGAAVLALDAGSVSPAVTGLASTVEGLALGPGGTLYTSDRTGTLMAHDAAGSTPAWTEAGAEYRWMAESSGAGGIAEGLLVWDDTSDELLLFEDFDFSAAPTVLGTGFTGVKGLAFGPDGYLYLSSSADEITRLVPIPAPATLGALAGLGLASARRRRG